MTDQKDTGTPTRAPLPTHLLPPSHAAVAQSVERMRAAHRDARRELDVVQANLPDLLAWAEDMADDSAQLAEARATLIAVAWHGAIGLELEAIGELPTAKLCDLAEQRHRKLETMHDLETDGHRLRGENTDEQLHKQAQLVVDLRDRLTTAREQARVLDQVRFALKSAGYGHDVEGRCSVPPSIDEVAPAVQQLVERSGKLDDQAAELATARNELVGFSWHRDRMCTGDDLATVDLCKLAHDQLLELEADRADLYDVSRNLQDWRGFAADLVRDGLLHPGDTDAGLQHLVRKRIAAWRAWACQVLENTGAEGTDDELRLQLEGEQLARTHEIDVAEGRVEDWRAWALGLAPTIVRTVNDAMLRRAVAAEVAEQMGLERSQQLDTLQAEIDALRRLEQQEHAELEQLRAMAAGVRAILQGHGLLEATP